MIDANGPLSKSRSAAWQPHSAWEQLIVRAHNQRPRPRRNHQRRNPKIEIGAPTKLLRTSIINTIMPSVLAAAPRPPSRMSSRDMVEFSLDDLFGPPRVPTPSDLTYRTGSIAPLWVSYPRIAEDAKPPGGQLLAALHPNLGIAAQYQRKLAALIDAMHPEMLAIINLSAVSPHRSRAPARPEGRQRLQSRERAYDHN
jgi:hypothetical protein